MDFEKFFKLTDRPFKSTLEGKYFFRRPAFDELRELLASSRGDLPVVLFLKGPEGVGKSTFIRRLPGALKDSTKMVPILGPSFQLGEILSTTLNFLGMGFKCPPSAKDESLLGFFQNAVSQLVESGQGLVLAVDDAPSLGAEVLEDLLALTRLEPSWAGRTTLMLAGPDSPSWPGDALPPEALVVELPPMELKETLEYLSHRLRAAGAAKNHFSPEAAAAIQAYGEGLLAKTNALAERGLMMAWAAGRQTVSAADIHLAKANIDKPLTVSEAAAKAASSKRRRHHQALGRAWGSLLAAALLVTGVGAAVALQRDKAAPAKAEPPAAVEPAETSLPVATATPAAAPALPQEGGLALPSPPPNLLNLPHNTLALVIDSGQKLGRLWQGGLAGAGLKAEVAVPDFGSPGLYLVGRPRGKDTLLFQFPLAKEAPKAAGERLWAQVEPLLPQDVLPLLVAEGQSLARKVPDDLLESLAGKVAGWRRAQEYKLADEMAALYAESFQYFEPGHKPLSINRRNFRAALDSESQVAGDVKLAVSDPLIMVDPRGQSRAWAVFNLKYDSRIRHDTGLRALVFERSLMSGQWLIVAELWLKEDSPIIN
jgi:type II secretory pathway predicted ATPase ExeA